MILYNILLHIIHYPGRFAAPGPRRTGDPEGPGVGCQHAGTY